MRHGSYGSLSRGVTVALFISIIGSVATGAVIYGSPGYDAATRTGYQGGGDNIGNIVADGTSVGTAYETYVNGISMGARPVRWGVSGAATELGNLGTNSRGFTNAYATA